MKKNYQKMKYQLNPEINEQYKKRYLENPELHKKIKKSGIINVKKRKNVLIRLRTFSTSKTRPLLYLHNMSSKPDKHSVRFIKHAKYEIVTSLLYHPVKSFDEKLYICATCQKYLYKNTIPFQTVCNKMALDPIPDELKDLKKIGIVLSFKRIFLKKIAIIHEKEEICKITESICNIPIEAANICNILPRSAVSNGLIVVKLKRDQKYRCHVYFQPVRPHIVHHALSYLKSYNTFYDNIFIAKGLTGEEMFKFSDIVEIQGQCECVTVKKCF